MKKLMQYRKQHDYEITLINRKVKTMVFINYPKCTTCKNAKNWLDENNIEYEERHIKENNPTYNELKEWYKKSNLPLKRFFNTSGMLYKSMNLKDKLPTMTEEEQLMLLASDGMLVRRPLLIDGDNILIGFKQPQWKAVLLKE